MKFFEFIERNKFGVFGTIAVHLVIYIWFNLQTVLVKVEPPKDRVVAVMDFSEQDDQPIEDKLKKTPISEVNLNQFDLKSVAANASQEKTTYTNKFSKSSADKAVWDELKALEKEEYNLINGDKEDNVTDNTDQKTNKNINKNLVDENASENDNASFGMDIKAIASYYLPSRGTLSQSLPAYKCKTEGIVRVTIKVNQKGAVVQTEIDESKTNTSNTCLRQEAIGYAKKWKFDQNFNDPIRKQGWIEFSYIAQ